MTAKDLKETAFRIDKYHSHYDFTPLELEMFCEQYSREQKEQDKKAVEYWMRFCEATGTKFHVTTMYSAIDNAKYPEL